MKPVKIVLALILSVFVFISQISICQSKPAPGLYKLDNSGKYILTFNGKTYYADSKPIASLNSMSNFNITKNKANNRYFSLNFELDAQTTKKINDRPPFYMDFKPHYIGLIIQGKLICVAQWSMMSPIGKLALNDTSKIKLEEIAHKIKAGQAPKS